MLSFKKLGKPVSLLFMAVIINSCAGTGMSAKPSQNIYYTTPPVTFLREIPGYDSPNVDAVHRGDEVVILSRQADSWWRVQAVRSGKIGWIQSPLLSAEPIATPTYFVQASKVQLQDAPQKHAPSLKVLCQGDKVRKLSENQEGWWMVLAEKNKDLGWIPATAVSEREPKTASPLKPAGPSGQGSARETASPPPPSKQLYYVATDNLNLHSLPLVSSQVVNTLKFNERVEKIGQSDSQWIKVRYPVNGAQGWAREMFLADSSLKSPRVFPQHTRQKRTAPRRPVCPKPAKPEKTQPEEIEPVVL